MCNWGYLLGTVSLIVEGSFVVLGVICLMRIGRAWQPNSDDAGYGWSCTRTYTPQLARDCPHISGVWRYLEAAWYPHFAIGGQAVDRS